MKSHKRKKPSYKSFRLSKRIKPPIQKDLPSVRKLISDTCLHIWRYKRIFFGVMVVYILLNLVLVKSFKTALDVPSLKDELQNSSSLQGFSLGATLLGMVASSGVGGTTEVANLYQSIITIITILAFIWLFRETHEHRKKVTIKLKQPYYEGMTPIIPFVLSLMLIGLQLLPMMIGVGVFSLVQTNGLAVTAVETFVWALFAILLSLLSFYLVSASMFGLIIVTLPKSTPISAYKSAKSVVAFRRWTIMRKLLIFIILIGLAYAGVLIGCILILPALVEWLMIILTAIILPIGIGAGYKLYRALL